MPPPVTSPDPDAIKTSWPIPKLGIRIDDLGHSASHLFLAEVNPYTAIRDAVITTFTWLYTQETVPTNVNSIIIVLRSMEGVAYTIGTRSHKEIHFSLDHIQNCAHRARDEILGVLTHEMVHCFQYDGKGKCPGGLIEGIADFVRLRAALPPPHWKRSGGDRWDAGYETTAYFLDWIEERHGEGTVRDLNKCMKDKEYVDGIFEEVTGWDVEKLWNIYCGHLEEEK